MSQGNNDESIFILKLDTTIILEDQIDDDYEPSERGNINYNTLEINSYAEFLGMNLNVDRDLLWIARDGLKAPLPENWKACKTGNQEIYYFNFKTGESIWDHPCDQQFKELYKKEKAKKQSSEKNAVEKYAEQLKIESEV